MRKTLPGRARGFTLIEMIAAFVIFAIAVGALMQILTMSMNNARRSADETRAALWAQTLLDNVGVGERVEAGSSHGEFDRSYRWELQIDQIDPELVVADATEPSGNAASAPAAAAGAGLLPQIDLFHVVLTVIWGDGSHERQAQFSTLRTATADPNHSGSISGADLSGGRSNRGMSTDRAGQSRNPAGGGRR
ncbi:MAG: prepilin-type N-terminal cleavage/methylation domain-containing protein [Dokdonella sp.]|nr:prepilin-type N-terminal cleavage/methylation domain-containing protein [Dokdonella sp.]MCB1578150.1 prepilin-type N-terminal cleavage/methylation domain-containing protein [Xanthomonadales bacterium]